MGITQIDMLTLKNKVQTAIDLIVAFEPPVYPYEVANSGGKDSGTIVKLVQLAEPQLKRKPDYVYCVSPIDPPEVYRHLKENHPETEWRYFARGFWDTVVKKGLPMRQTRWCCQIIKEASGKDRTVIVGNRAEEGTIRKGQQCFGEHRNKKFNKFFLRPIITWTEGEVWEFHRLYKLPYCSLYDEGSSGPYKGDGLFHRIGCVLCPFSRNGKKEIARFPKIANNWRFVCDRIVADRISRGNISKRGKPYKQQFTSGEELWNWWISRS